MKNVGLNMATGANAFMNAVDFMDRRQDRKQARGLRDMQAGMTQESHGRAMRDSDQAHQMREEMHGMRGEAHQMGKESHQMGRQSHQAKLESQRLQQSRQLMENEELMMGILAKEAAAIEAGTQPRYSEQEEQAKQLFPDLSSEYMTSPELGKALESAERVIAGDLEMNSPEAIEAINMLFSEVQAGADDGRQRRVAAVAPGRSPGTLVFGLEVEGEEGLRPLTDGRSSDSNDPVKEVPIEAIIEKVASKKNMRDLLSSPEGRQFLMSRQGMGGQAQERFSDVYKDESTGLIGQRNEATNEFRKLGEATGPGGARGQDPANIRAADAYIARLKGEGREAPAFEQAYQIVNSSMADPLNFIGQYMRSEMERQSAYGVAPGDDDYRTPEQIKEDAIETVKGIRRSLGQEAGDMRHVDEAIKQAEKQGAERGGADMPDPGQHKGRIVRDNESGKRFRSNGNSWEEIQ